MVLLAVDDHQYWTEVGYGLEPILPDGKVGGFGRDMLPLLRQSQYGAALFQISSQIASTIAAGSRRYAEPERAGDVATAGGIPGTCFPWNSSGSC